MGHRIIGNGSANGILAAGLEYLERGWVCFPARGKQPLVKWKHYQTRRPTADELRAQFKSHREANLAVVTGAISEIVVIDVDSEEGERQLEAFGPLPPTLVSRTAKGRHLVFRYPGVPVPTRVGLRQGIDVRADGGYIIAPPSVHSTGVQYAWVDPALVPAELTDQLLHLLLSEPTNGSTPVPRPARTVVAKQSVRRVTLPCAIPDRQRNVTLFQYASSLRGLGVEGELHAALNTANGRAMPPLSDKEVTTIAASAGEFPASSTEHLTDLGNARRLAQRFGDELRFVASSSAWLVWNGCHWERDLTGEVVRRAKETVRAMYAEAATIMDTALREQVIRWALVSESEARIRAMVNLARSEPGVAITAALLDKDPWLLSVGNGTINLRSGQLQPHDPGDLLTRVIPINYDPDARAARWEGFLATLMGDDRGLIDYLQRLVGYSLTGDVSEQILVFLHGYGANGKSTFLNTVLEVMGPYGKQADPHLLVARPNDSHPTNMADLMGSRFVVCSEVDEGRALAEATVKQLTGGDLIKARFMRQDFFQFEPTHKIWLAANHKPVIKGTDHAIWRRIRLVPFGITIPEAEQDRQLSMKLREELPGILAWAVRGCLDWQAQGGLREPEAVKAATAEYRSGMDLIAQFIEESCDQGTGFEVAAKELYAAYVTWSDSNGLHPCAHASFGRKIQERGYGRRKSTGGRLLYVGLKLQQGSG